MKKILTSLVITAMLAATASADLGRIEMGLGSWLQTPSGSVSRTDGKGFLDLNGNYKSAEQSSNELYFWMLIKHPVPIVPNLRLEYVSISDEGTMTGSVGGSPVLPNSFVTTEMTQFDVVGYYNILDNTAWTTIDLGFDIKIIDTTSKVSSVNYKSSDSAVIPLLYVRTRVEIPATNLGLEADVKFITYGDETTYDIRVKVDYTLDFIPVVQPALELGYRMQQFDVDDGGTQIDLKYSGVYAGLMMRF